jgi:hypothetical protein
MGERVIINGKTETIKGLLVMRCTEMCKKVTQVVSKAVLHSVVYTAPGKGTTIAWKGHSGAQ